MQRVVKEFKHSDIFYVRKWGRGFIFELTIINDRKPDDPNDTVFAWQHGAVKLGDKCFIEYNEKTRDVAVGLDDQEVVSVDGKAYMLVLADVHERPEADNHHKHLMRFISLDEVIGAQQSTVHGDFIFECEAALDTVCGQNGIPHRMKRHNCYTTTCVNIGCNHTI